MTSEINKWQKQGESISKYIAENNQKHTKELLEVAVFVSFSMKLNQKHKIWAKTKSLNLDFILQFEKRGAESMLWQLRMRRKWRSRDRVPPKQRRRGPLVMILRLRWRPRRLKPAHLPIPPIVTPPAPLLRHRLLIISYLHLKIHLKSTKSNQKLEKNEVEKGEMNASSAFLSPHFALSLSLAFVVHHCSAHSKMNSLYFNFACDFLFI